MAVDEATKKQDELELYQIDDKAIMPFFQCHCEELKQFIQERRAQNLSLLELLKQFIRTYKLPFNVLQERMQDRQVAVSRWIQEHAGRHRNRMIQLQCLYLDRIKDKLLPEIQKMLEQRIENLQSKVDENK
jgi:DNA-binding transcriptional regulator YbjK